MDALNIISTILASSVATAIVTHILTASRAETDFKRKKLEELFIAAQNHVSHLMRIYQQIEAVAAGIQTMEKAKETIYGESKLHDKDRSEAERNYGTFASLTNIYFRSEMLPHFDKLQETREKLRLLEEEFERRYDEGEFTIDISASVAVANRFRRLRDTLFLQSENFYAELYKVGAMLPFQSWYYKGPMWLYRKVFKPSALLVKEQCQN